MQTTANCPYSKAISLAGFMGCGKSSVGRQLSELLSCPLIDLDEYIEERQGRPIPEIFSSEGESAFRTLELSYLSEILSGVQQDDLLVLSLGGGTLTTEDCARLVSERTYCIYLRATTDTLADNLKNGLQNRPMLNQASPGQDDRILRSRIEELMLKRSAIYESTAHHIIDTDGKTVTQIAAEIARMLKSCRKVR